MKIGVEGQNKALRRVIKEFDVSSILKINKIKFKTISIIIYFLNIVFVIKEIRHNFKLRYHYTFRYLNIHIYRQICMRDIIERT